MSSQFSKGLLILLSKNPIAEWGQQLKNKSRPTIRLNLDNRNQMVEHDISNSQANESSVVAGAKTPRKARRDKRVMGIKRSSQNGSAKPTR
jgi:hypothetical protein